MNGYKCFYRGKSVEVYAENKLQAQEKAAKLLKAKKHYDVTVVLCEKDGEQVTHTADF
jgi:predicted Fe-Mo cluster-binding NifX family protein